MDRYVMEQGLVMGYEMVTGNTFYGDRTFSGPDDERIVYLMSELVPKGFGYFGHGHNHIDHDELSYEEALESFQANYDTMKDWGMKPVAYAYPRSAGHEEETQRALEASGFLSGRLQTTNPGEFYNLPGSRSAPDNWFGLRALEMQSIEFQGCDACINDNDELVPVLDEALAQTAWVILTYHAIGKPEWWGWYDWGEFRKDVQSGAEQFEQALGGALTDAETGAQRRIAPLDGTGGAMALVQHHFDGMEQRGARRAKLSRRRRGDDETGHAGGRGEDACSAPRPRTGTGAPGSPPALANASSRGSTRLWASTRPGTRWRRDFASFAHSPTPRVLIGD